MSKPNKKMTILDIKNAISNGEITTYEINDLLVAYPSNKPIINNQKEKNAVSQVISYIGASLVFLGILFISSIYWESFDSWLKVSISLGSGLLLWLISVLLLNTKVHRSIPLAFHFISILLVSFGIGVLVYEVFKPEPSQYAIYLGIGFIFATLIQGIQLIFQKHWANILSIYFYFLASFWLSYAYLVTRFNITTTITQYILFGFTGLALMYGSKFFRVTFSHVSRLFQIFGSMFLFAMAFGITTEYKWFYGFIMVLALLAGLVFGIIKRYIITIGVSIFWMFIYIQWLSSEYFRNQVGWGQSLIILGVTLILIFQTLRSRSTYKLSTKKIL